MRTTNCGYNYRHSKGFRINRPNGSGDYVLLVVRSAASFLLKGRECFTDGNAVIIFNKDTPQFYGSSTCDFINDWVHFDCDEEDLLFLADLGIEFDKLLKLQNVSELSSLIKRMCFEKYSSNKNAMRSVALYLHLLLLKISDLQVQKQSADSALHKQLTDLKNNIFSQPQHNWRIDDISKALSVSKSYLQHQYKSLFGSSIKRDVIVSRIEYSKYLLFSTDYTVTAVSHLCGFENHVHFMRTFKKETGLTPSVYRKSLNYSHSQVAESKKHPPFAP